MGGQAGWQSRGRANGKVGATIEESNQGIIQEGNQKNKSDDSSAFRKTDEKPQEFAALLPSQSPDRRPTQNGLTSASVVAVNESNLAKVEEINTLKDEMARIKGEWPKNADVLAVLAALRGASVVRFVQHLRGVNSRYRPGGHRAVRKWKWFISTADSFAQSWIDEAPDYLDRSDRIWRHGKVDLACPQCLPRPEFDRMTEALGD